MKKIKELFSKGLELTEKVVGHATEAGKSVKEHWEENRELEGKSQLRRKSL